MADITYMIAVMTHYANGGSVDNRALKNGTWCTSTPVWDWDKYEYRITPVDPYARLKILAKDPTKQIRINFRPTLPEGEWRDAGWHWSWDYPPEAYEVRDSPKKIKLLAVLLYNQLMWFTEEGISEYGLKGLLRIPKEDKICEAEILNPF